MSLTIRPFSKKTIKIRDIKRAFDDEREILTVYCSDCKHDLNIEYSFIRALAGKILSRSRSLRKKRKKWK